MSMFARHKGRDEGSSQMAHFMLCLQLTIRADARVDADPIIRLYLPCKLQGRLFRAACQVSKARPGHYATVGGIIGWLEEDGCYARDGSLHDENCRWMLDSHGIAHAYYTDDDHKALEEMLHEDQIKTSCIQTGNIHLFICKELRQHDGGGWEKAYAFLDGIVCWKCNQPDDTHLTLICSNPECLDFWHTYCLTPALDQVPPADEDWFCPKCQLQGKTATLDATPMYHHVMQRSRCCDGETTFTPT